MPSFSRPITDTAVATDVATYNFPRAYEKQTWIDAVTPVNAVRLNTIETALARLNYLPISPRDFGAVGDGVADDTKAINDMIASKVPKQAAGVIPVAIDLGPYTYRITSTITITQMAISWRGQGIGNPANYAIPGFGTTFRWDGPAGIAMFNMVDCRDQLFESIYFQGNTTNRPSDFIYSVGGGSIGTNGYLTVRKCKFGSIPWSNPATPAGTMCADYAIRYGPTNANNDRMFFQDLDIEDVTTGYATPDTQSVWGSMINTSFTNCTTGIDVASDITLVNVNFQGCVLDMKIQSTANVRAFSIGSEHSQQVANIPNPGGSLTVVGGRWLIQNTMTNTRLIDYANIGDATALVLMGVAVLNIGAISPKPVVYARRNSAGNAGQLSVEGCPGLQTVADFDVLGAAGGIHCNIHSLGMSTEQTLGAGDKLGIVNPTARFYVVATGEETSSRNNLTHQNGVAVDGTLYLTYFTAQKTQTITQITTTVGSTGAAATQTLSRIGIYSEATNGDLTLVTGADTVNDTALWRSAYTDYTKTFAASWTKTAGTVYAVGCLLKSTAAFPNWIGFNAPQVGIIGAKVSTRPRLCGSYAGQTDLPSTIANGNIGQSTQPCYALLLP